VNVANDPPTAPAIAGPSDNSSVSVLSPALAVNNASDPDSAGLTYNFEVALDPDFVSMVTSTTGVMQGGRNVMGAACGASGEHPVLLALPGGRLVGYGLWSATATFFVNTSNEPPSSQRSFLRPGMRSLQVRPRT